MQQTSSAPELAVGPALRADRWARLRSLRPIHLLAAVAASYVVVQLIVMPVTMGISWDESVYLSQVRPGVPAGYMSAPRAHGMQLVAAPVTLITDSVIALRLYMTLVAGAVLFLAFWPWLRLRDGFVVPLAALLYAALWPAIYYGQHVLPNIVTAGASVAAVGLFVQAVQRKGAWQPLTGLAVAFAALGLMRPTDTVYVAGPMVLAALIYRPWRQIKPVVALGLGAAVGWTPWIIDGFARFGSPMSRLDEANRVNDIGLQFAFVRELRVFGGNSFCGFWTSDCGPVTPQATIIWALAPVLVGLGLWAQRGRPGLPALVLTTVAGIASLLPYFFTIGIASPRFLLMGYMLLAPAAAEGLRWIATRHRFMTIGAVAGVLVFVAGQLSVASSASAETEQGRNVIKRYTARLEALGVGDRPCFIFGRGDVQTAYTLRCASLGDRRLPTLTPRGREIRGVLLAEVGKGKQVVVLARGERRPGFVPEGWHRTKLSTSAIRPVFAYLSGGPAGLSGGPAGQMN